MDGNADPRRRTIMLVDDNAAVLAAGKEMLRDLYRVYPIPSGDILLDIMENVQPDLILLDVEMPELSGYEVIAALKNDSRWKHVPVIFLTAMSDEGSELHGLTLGAIDYVAKPFSAPLLLKRIENHLRSVDRENQLQRFNASLEELVLRKTRHILSLQNSILSTVADLVEFRDHVTGGHIVRTRRYMGLMAEEMLRDGIYKEEISDWNMEHFVASSQLHDVGKLGISDAILNKTARLTPEEMEIMKKHVEIGVRAIKKIEDNLEGSLPENAFLRHARLIAGGHHEKWDGTGYPMGLQGGDIALEGRLMAIADVYDAMISVRPYKRPMATEEAKRYIEDNAAAHFDPLLVSVFVQVADQFAAITRAEAFR